MNELRFEQTLIPRPTPSGIDAITKLRHFAIITYAIPPERLRPHVHPRFDLDTIVKDGAIYALISVVPFMDEDFTAAAYPAPKLSMGQTNYRAYVIDRETSQRAVWFFGTVLDSWTVVLPRFAWKIPWHPGRIRFDCRFSSNTMTYDEYAMETRSHWAPAQLRLHHTPEAPIELPGFPDVETGLVVLTHPLAGYYYRRDGKLGSYSVWHDRLNVAAGNVEYANFGLLTRLGLLGEDEQQRPYSVLIDPVTEFTIYLPPKII